MRKYMRVGDTQPYLAVVLKRVYDSPMRAEADNLAGATIKFHMKDLVTGTLKVDATLAGTELVDLANGKVRYEWETGEESGDTDTAGEYLAEFEVTYGDGAVATYWDMRTVDDVEAGEPPEPLIISIVEDLG